MSIENGVSTHRTPAECYVYRLGSNFGHVLQVTNLRDLEMLTKIEFIRGLYEDYHAHPITVQ